MSLTPGGQETPTAIDQDALRKALATPIPPGFDNLHSLNTTLDTSKNIPGVEGGIPLMYNIPATFAQAQTMHNDLSNAANDLAANETALLGNGASQADIDNMNASIADAQAGLADYQAQTIGTRGAAPGTPGSIGFANISSMAGMGNGVEGMNAATGTNPLCGFLDGLFDFLGGLTQGIIDAIEAISSAIADAISAIGQIIGNVIGAIAEAIAVAVQALAEVIAAVIGAIAEGIAALFDFIGSISLPSFLSNPCAKAGMDKVTSDVGSAALETATDGTLTPSPTNPGVSI